MRRDYSKYYTVFLLFFFVISVSVTAAKTPFVVVLDAGHGGHDPGAVGAHIQEKKINLEVVLKLGQLIEKNYDDVKVIYTRKTDKYITLQNRADIANNAHANLFISVHTNANNNKSAYGSETYTLGLTKSKSNLDVAMRENSVILLEDDYKVKYEGFNPKSVDSYIMFECIQDKFLDTSVQMAQNIQKNFSGLGRKDRGVRQAGFWVLHKTAMPSVLVEVGYISNPQEEKFLRTESGQQKMASAVFSSFEQFKKEYDLKSGQQYAYESSSKTNAGTKSTSSHKTETVQVVNSVKVLEPKKIDGVEDQGSKKLDVASVEKAFGRTKVAPEDVKIYKLQLFAVAKKLPSNSSSFKGLVVDYFVEKNLYKYTYGSTTSYEDIKEQKKQISSKFPDAMVVAFKNGKKVSVR